MLYGQHEIKTNLYALIHIHLFHYSLPKIQLNLIYSYEINWWYAVFYMCVKKEIADAEYGLLYKIFRQITMINNSLFFSSGGGYSWCCDPEAVIWGLVQVWGRGCGNLKSTTWRYGDIWVILKTFMWLTEIGVQMSRSMQQNSEYTET